MYTYNVMYVYIFRLTYVHSFTAFINMRACGMRVWQWIMG